MLIEMELLARERHERRQHESANRARVRGLKLTRVPEPRRTRNLFGLR